MCVCVCVCVLCVCVQEGGTDYYVEGMRCRNRALDRDVVAIKVLPPQQWVVRVVCVPIVSAFTVIFDN